MTKTGFVLFSEPLHVLAVRKLNREINFTNFGCTVAYLAYVYLQRENEETIRHNVQKCDEEYRKFDIPKLKRINQRPILITLLLALIVYNVIHSPPIALATGIFGEYFVPRGTLGFFRDHCR